VAVIDPADCRGLVEVAGVRREINLHCIVDEGHPVEACIGDWVLVHVGFAMSRIDEREARETLRILTELGEMQREMENLSL
jgi:hydrogenase expression/formation protein HypC